jgi:hypothetical protein
MPKHHIRIEKHFSQPIERIYQDITDHENFGKLIGSSIKRIKEGADGYPNGEGSVRKITALPLPPFEETVTSYKLNDYFEYKVTKGSPIKNHIGRLKFTTDNSGCSLVYTIDYDMKLNLPLAGKLLSKILGKQISQGLDKLNKS